MYTEDALIRTLLKYNFDLCKESLPLSDFLNRNYDEYINDLKSAIAGDNASLSGDFIEKVKNKMPDLQFECDSLIGILKLHEMGKIREFYDEAFKLFDDLIEYYLYAYDFTGYRGHYYRLRKGDFRIKSGDDPKDKKKELFHIKNDKRNKIGAYRYSISGYPCLYLAEGIELAWFESGMPRQFSYCQFKLNPSIDGSDDRHIIKLVDFSQRPVECLSQIQVDIINAGDKKDEKKLANIYSYFLKYILIYPLVAACSVKVKDRTQNFNEEYIISQAFMCWVRESDTLDGIKYKSSLYNDLVRAMGANNIVFAVKDFDDMGLSKSLTDKLLVSDIGYFDVDKYFRKKKPYIKEIDLVIAQMTSHLNNGIISGGNAFMIIQYMQTVSKVLSALEEGNYTNTELVLTAENFLTFCKDDCYWSMEKIITDTESNLRKDEKEKFNRDIFTEDIRKCKNVLEKALNYHEEYRFNTEIMGNYEII